MALIALQLSRSSLSSLTTLIRVHVSKRGPVDVNSNTHLTNLKLNKLSAAALCLGLFSSPIWADNLEQSRSKTDSKAHSKTDSKVRSPLCPPLVINPEPPIERSTEETEQLLLGAKLNNDQLGWVVDPEAGSCGGYYQLDSIADTLGHSDNLQNSTALSSHMSADSMAYSESGEASLSGNVLFYQGSRRFYCDSLQYQAQTGQAQIQGNIEFHLGDLLVSADKAEFNNQSLSGEFEQTAFAIPAMQARGHARQLSILGQVANEQESEQNNFSMHDSYFTLCPPTRNDWALSMSELHIDRDKGWGKAWHTRFLIKDVPVFYFPYIDFPIDDRRKTGFLFPSISGGNDGLDYQQSYYINLAPHYDMTYTPHYIRKHGLMHAIEGRYKNPYSEWQIGGSSINNDKRIDGDDIAKTPTLEKEDGKRWSGVLRETGSFGPHWTHGIDYSNVSDVNYLRDWGGAGLDIRHSAKIKRGAHLSYNENNFSGKLEVIDYKSLEIDRNTGKVKNSEYDILPQLSLSYSANKSPWQLSPIAKSIISKFDHPDKINATRTYAETGLAYTMANSAFSLEQAVKLKGLHYRYNDDDLDTIPNAPNGEPFAESADVLIPNYLLDAKLYFEREIAITHSKLQTEDPYAKQGLIQTLTPRLQYYYADYEAQLDQGDFDTSESSYSYSQAFREERFSGYDRISDANRISFGLETSFLRAGDGRKLLSAGLVQTRYLNDRRVSLKASDLEEKLIDPTDSQDNIDYKEAFNTKLKKKYFRHYSDLAYKSTWHISEAQSLSLNGVYDQDQNQQEKTSIAWQYSNDAGAAINLAWFFERKTPKLADTDDDSSTPKTLVNQDSESALFSFYTPLDALNANWSEQWSFYGVLDYDLEKKESIEDLAGLKYESCCWSIYLASQRERKQYEQGVKVERWDDSKYDRYWFIEFELKGLSGVTSSFARVLAESIDGFMP